VNFSVKQDLDAMLSLCIRSYVEAATAVGRVIYLSKAVTTGIFASVIASGVSRNYKSL
jgi:hypothetical protein